MILIEHSPEMVLFFIDIASIAVWYKIIKNTGYFVWLLYLSRVQQLIIVAYCLILQAEKLLTNVTNCTNS